MKERKYWQVPRDSMAIFEVLGKYEYDCVGEKGIIAIYTEKNIRVGMIHHGDKVVVNYDTENFNQIPHAIALRKLLDSLDIGDHEEEPSREETIQRLEQKVQNLARQIRRNE